ncbi:site-2 protease family protein, partial [Richelia intracellularis]|uniref:site-2 protease family protein n=1 Tax=Richelia intracellularis TaxID=1164990 RepID=UPI002F2B47F3
MIENATPIYHPPRNIQEVFGTAANKFQQLVIRTFQGFGQLITNFQNTADKLAGPVKIVEAGAKLAATDSTNLLFFAAIISINLAVINILPLPALDGGQLA